MRVKLLLATILAASLFGSSAHGYGPAELKAASVALVSRLQLDLKASTAAPSTVAFIPLVSDAASAPQAWILSDDIISTMLESGAFILRSSSAADSNLLITGALAQLGEKWVASLRVEDFKTHRWSAIEQGFVAPSSSTATPPAEPPVAAPASAATLPQGRAPLLLYAGAASLPEAGWDGGLGYRPKDSLQVSLEIGGFVRGDHAEIRQSNGVTLVADSRQNIHYLRAKAEYLQPLGRHPLRLKAGGGLGTYFIANYDNRENSTNQAPTEAIHSTLLLPFIDSGLAWQFGRLWEIEALAEYTLASFRRFGVGSYQAGGIALRAHLVYRIF